MYICVCVGGGGGGYVGWGWGWGRGGEGVMEGRRRCIETEESDSSFG